MLIPILCNNTDLNKHVKKLTEEFNEFITEIDNSINTCKQNEDNIFEEGYDLIQVCTNIIYKFDKNVKVIKLEENKSKYYSIELLKKNLLHYYNDLKQYINEIELYKIYSTEKIIKCCKEIIKETINILEKINDVEYYNKRHLDKLLSRGWEIFKMIKIEYEEDGIPW